MLYTYTSSASQRHNNKDRRKDKDARRLLFKYIYPHFICKVCV